MPKTKGPTLKDQLTACGLTRQQVKLLVQEYEITLAPVFLRAALKAGKDLAPLDEQDDLDRYAAAQDEEALEKALDDKWARRKAAQLLSKMPQSRYMKRMEERVLTRLRVKGNVLEADCVECVTDDMVRDGLPVPGSTLSIVDRWDYLYALVRVMPPNVWERKFNMTPAQLLRLQTDNWQKRSVVEGWRGAAILHQDENWLEVFCMDPSFDGAAGLLVHHVVESGLRERLLLKLIQRNNGTLYVSTTGDVNQPVMTALKACNHEWSEAFARTLLPLLVKEASKPSRYGVFVLEEVAAYFPVSLLESAEREFQSVSEVPSVVIFLATLRFKSEIYTVLN